MAWTLMFLSGWAALTYEAVWLRMLARSFGVTVHAVAALVALYMAGLAIGAAAGARLRWRGDWLKLYAGLEAASGVLALLGTWWLVRLPAVVAAGPEGGMSAAQRLALAAPALLPPTILLGATLPVLTRRYAEAARLYGANTLGATAGLAAASFVLIGWLGETAAVASAAALNVVCAGLAWSVSGSGRAGTAAQARPVPRSKGPLVVFLFAASGFCALGYEVVWARQLVPLIGNSTYAFALLLVCYLAGIGIGSWAGARQRSSGGALAEFGLLLTATGCAAALSAAAYRVIGLSLDSPRFLYSPLRSFGDFGLIALITAAVVFPVSLLLGALFPAAYRAVQASADDGAAAGRLYAWNTVGGILGSLCVGFWGIERLGANGVFLALAGAQAAAGFAALAAARQARWKPAVGLAVAGLTAAIFARVDPSLDILKKRLRASDLEIMFHDESAAATVTGVRFRRPPRESRNLYVNGIDTSGDGLAGIIMTVIPHMMIETVDRTLVICLGAGNTVRTATRLGGVVDGVELIEDIVRRLPLFESRRFPMAGSPRLMTEDGRQFLLRTDRTYDLIVVDGPPPLYAAGGVNLFSSEFMRLARERLSDRGVFCLWLPSQSFESDYWQIVRSAVDEYPHVRLWGDPRLPGFLILGSKSPIELDKAKIAARVKKRMPAMGMKWLDAQYVLDGFMLTPEEIRAQAARYQPVTDDRPTVEFPLPRFWRGERLEPDIYFLAKARRR